MNLQRTKRQASDKAQRAAKEKAEELLKDTKKSNKIVKDLRFDEYAHINYESKVIVSSVTKQSKIYTLDIMNREKEQEEIKAEAKKRYEIMNEIKKLQQEENSSKTKHIAKSGAKNIIPIVFKIAPKLGAMAIKSIL